MKLRTETTVLPEMERMLTVAAAGQMEESSPRAGRRVAGWRLSRIAAVGAACLAFGGTAMAATGVWSPSIGTHANGGPPTTSATPVPTAMTEALGVLRRDPTAQDRSAEVEATLAGAGEANGLRPDSVRYLAPGAPGTHGEATVLLSAQSVKPFIAEGEPVCVYRPALNGFKPGAQDIAACFDASQLLSGKAYEMYTNEPTGEEVAFGLAPDGVATVTAEFGSAPDVTVPVTNNYFEVPLGGAEMSNANGEAGVQHVVWRDADGNLVPQQPGNGD